MAQTRSVTVKIEGIEALSEVVAQLEAIREQIAQLSPGVAAEVGRALNGASARASRRLCDPEV